MNSKIIKKAMSFLMVLAVMSSTLAAPVFNIGTVLVNAEDAPITEPINEETTSSETISEEVIEPVSEDPTASNNETVSEEPITPIEPISEDPTTPVETVSEEPNAPIEPVVPTTQATAAKVATNTNTNSVNVPEITPMAVCTDESNNSSAPHLTSITQVAGTEEIIIEYSGSGSDANPTVPVGYEVTSLSFFIPPEANVGNTEDIIIGPLYPSDFTEPLDFETGGPGTPNTTSFFLPTENREPLREHMKKNGKFELKYELTMTKTDGSGECITKKTTDTKKLEYIPVLPEEYTSSILFAYEPPIICSDTGVGTLDLSWSYSDTLIGLSGAIVEIYLDGVLLDGSTFAPSDSDPGIRDNAVTASPGEHYVSITVTDATDSSIVYTFANNFFTVPEPTIPVISTFSATPSADGMSIDVIADIDLNNFEDEVTASITVTTPDRFEETYEDIPLDVLADLPPYPIYMGGTYIFDLTINFNDSGTDCAKTASARVDVPAPTFIEVYPSEQDICTPNNLVDIFWYYDPGYADQDVLIEVSIDGKTISSSMPDAEGFGELLNYGPLADGEHDATISIIDGDTIVDEYTYTFTTPMLISPEITKFSATAGDDMNVLLDYEIDLGSIFEIPAFLFSAQLEVTGPNGYSDTIVVELDEFDYTTSGQIDYEVPQAGTYEFTLTLDYEDDVSSCAISTQSTTVTVKEPDTLAYTGNETSRFESFIIKIQEMFI